MNQHVSGASVFFDSLLAETAAAIAVTDTQKRVARTDRIPALTTAKPPQPHDPRASGIENERQGSHDLTRSQVGDQGKSRTSSSAFQRCSFPFVKSQRKRFRTREAIS